jgi:hypothetical protein
MALAGAQGADLVVIHPVTTELVLMVAELVHDLVFVLVRHR